jgi:hypothetical protein
MKAIAIRQPWAALIVSGVKNIENRSWGTHYRGPLAIYASKSFSKADMRDAQDICKRHGICFPSEFLTGGIIGVVDFVGLAIPRPQKWIPTPTFDKPELASTPLTWYDRGAIGWVLQNPRPIEFIKYCGRLGLFEIPDELISI